MKNILVPVDFSEPSKHAALYAISLAEQIHAEKIILYNAFQQPMPTDPMLIEPAMNTMEAYNVAELADISRDHLQRFKEDLVRLHKPALISIEAIGEFNDITEGIEEVCVSHQISLVVTGITIGDKLTETLIGSHALDIAKQITVPVLIVPPDADYTPIRNILFACDLKQVAKTTPVHPIQNILYETGSKLHILHVNEDGKQPAEVNNEIETLKSLLQSVQPQFHVIEHSNFAEAINQFAADKNINLVVAIPKKHGFFEGLFRKSHIKTLAFHTHTPLLLMHEE